MPDDLANIKMQLDALEAAVIGSGALDDRDDHEPDRWLSTPAQAAHYNVTCRTIERWRRDPKMGFPQPMTINGRNYTSLKATQAYDRQRAANKAKSKT